MLYLFSVVILSYIVSGHGQSPCPGTFDYQNGGGGLITIQASGPVSSVITRANFTIAARLPSSFVGQLEPLDSEQALQRFNRGSPLTYRVHFPVTSPLPKLTSLVVNGREICYGPADVPYPNQYVSTISLQHMLFLRPGSVNSVYYPVDQPNVAHPGHNIHVKPDDPQIFTITDDGKDWNSGTYYTYIVNKTQHHLTPNQPNNDFNIFYPDQTTKTTQRPTDYYPAQPQDYYPIYPEQTTKNPSQERPQQPPIDFNQFTTQRQPQPPPDYNPYNTQRPPQSYPDRSETEQPQQVFKPTPPRLPISEQPKQVGCGIVVGGNERLPLIYNGQSYERGDWPWLVAIYKRKDGSLTFTCSGTLISERHVITAAHCMQQKNSQTSIRDIVVKVGVYNLEDWGDDLSITRTLEAAVIHESYDASTLANDILVFTFEKTVEFSSNIRPACLWDGKADLNRIVGASGVVAGWGKSELGPAGHGEPRMVRIPVVSTSACRASKPDFHKLTSENTLCAGDRNGVGPCLGDSGGGLYILDSGRWRLRGVVSLSLRPESGDSTCNLNEYIVFTDAAKYLKWIKKIVSRL